MVRRIAFILLVMLFAGQSAIAGLCDAHFSFDGNLADGGSNGYDGQLVDNQGNRAQAQFVEGRSGQALQLNGASVMRALMELHPDVCPQLTISAWINVAPDAREGYVLSSEGEQGPGFRYFNRSLSMLGPNNGVTERDILYPNTWMHVAFVYDRERGVQTLHWGSRNSEKELGEQHMFPGPALWVGGYGPRVNYAPQGIAVDELRIIGRVLDQAQIADLRNAASGDVRTTAAAISDGTTLTQACAASAECPDGSYCGVDHACHPNSQLPIESAGTSAGIDYNREPDILTDGGIDGGAGQAGRDPSGIDYESDVGMLPGTPTGAVEDWDLEDDDVLGGAGAGTSASFKYIMLDYDMSVLAFSGVSGGVGDRTEQTLFPINRRFPYWIETRENYDKPCTVYVHAREVSSTSNTSEPLVREFDVCDGGLPRINPITTLRRIFRDPEAGDFKPMTGIEVCNNGINNRVKGIRARVRGVTMHGGYTPSYSTVEFEQRANCVSWQSMAHCPANTFAIGLRLHFRDGDIVSPRDFLSGLELVCANVRWMESDSAFGPWEPIQ